MSDEQLDAAGRDLKGEAEQRDADLKAVMATPAGRRFVMRLLRNARLEQASYAGELTRATAFNEGVREMGVKLNSELRRACWEEWLLMQQEHPPSKVVHHAGDASNP